MKTPTSLMYSSKNHVPGHAIKHILFKDIIYMYIACAFNANLLFTLSVSLTKIKFCTSLYYLFLVSLPIYMYMQFSNLHVLVQMYGTDTRSL